MPIQLKVDKLNAQKYRINFFVFRRYNILLCVDPFHFQHINVLDHGDRTWVVPMSYTTN